MKIDDIYPFVRFAAKQNFSVDVLFVRHQMVSYDHRIYFCISGKGTLFIDDMEYSVEPNTFVLWKAGQRYRMLPKEGEDLICLTCNFDYTIKYSHLVTPIVPSSINKFMPENKLEDIYFEDMPLFNDTIYIPHFSQAKELLFQIVDCYKNNLPHASIHLRSYILQILLLLANHSNNAKTESRRELVNQVINYIQTHYKENISNTEIANIVSYHPNYLSSIFLQETGHSLYQYITQYRLLKAFNYIMNTSKPIGDICEEINIPNPQYFSRLFKKYYGVSPQQLRKNAH